MKLIIAFLTMLVLVACNNSSDNSGPNEQADTTSPDISLLGSDLITLTVGDTYSEQGATAQDNVDGDITTSITLTGSVDTETSGEYLITYTVSDAAGNENTVTRTITVQAIIDTTSPDINLLGSDLITLTIGDTYSEQGATALDNIDGDITTNITLTGSVDTETRGEYSITYTISDAAGNTNTVTRTITVLASKPLLTALTISVTEDSTDNTVLGQVIVSDNGGAAISHFTLTGPSANQFTIESDGTIHVVSGSAIDYETSPSYLLQATASNVDAQSDSVAINIAVQKLNSRITQQLLASDGKREDYFGVSIAYSGDYIVVGATGTDDFGNASFPSGHPGNSSGSAYVFKKNAQGNYEEIAELAGDDLERSDYFGTRVAIDGDYIAVTAPGKDNSRGAAYVFKNNGNNEFTQVDKLLSPDIYSYTAFGSSIALQGNNLLIGQEGAHVHGHTAGAAYLFKNNGADDFVFQTSLKPALIGTYEHMGRSVAIDGDYIALGAPREYSATEAGIVYLFKFNGSGYDQLPSVQASDSSINDFFGYNVALKGNRLLVGAYLADGGGDNTGAAYVFTNDGSDTFVEQAILHDPGGATNDYYGQTVALSDDYVLVGARSKRYYGAVFVYKETSAGQYREFTRFDAKSPTQYFSSSLSIQDDIIAIGARRDSGGGLNLRGSAFTAKIEPTPEPYLIDVDDSYYLVEGNSYINTFTAKFFNTTNTQLSLHGDDASFFSLNEQGELNFLVPPSTDAPNDLNSDNNYDIEIQVSEPSGLSQSYSITIGVHEPFTGG